MTDSTHIEDGGPAFPCAEDHKVAADLPWTQGMSKRDLFAAILMHGEFAARDSDEFMDEIATNAALGADALLRALAAPEEAPIPAQLTYNAWATPDIEHRAIQSLALHPRFADMPPVIRDFVKVAVAAIAETHDGIPF